ncbi:MAG: class I SAM-dependent methyltransferase [Actinomycetota bacterium]|nr:class I SAM-dependent methyltransferase [Actinomycetota bacterium]
MTSWTETETFAALHHGLPRQAPGSDATTRLLAELARPVPDRPRVLDIGCGPGRASLVLAEHLGAVVEAIDLHEPFLDELRDAARARGLQDRISATRASMDALPFPQHHFDLVWAEGSIYLMGFDAALASWQHVLRPGGAIVVT